jgi:hypothetical protein
MFIILVTQTLLMALVREDARYTPGNNSLLGSKPVPLEGVGTLAMISVLALKVSLHGSVLFAVGLGSKFTITSSFIII